jgi:hypothetical protein
MDRFYSNRLRSYKTIIQDGTEQDSDFSTPIEYAVKGHKYFNEELLP